MCAGPLLGLPAVVLPISWNGRTAVTVATAAAGEEDDGRTTCVFLHWARGGGGGGDRVGFADSRATEVTDGRRARPERRSPSTTTVAGRGRERGREYRELQIVLRGGREEMMRMGEEDEGEVTERRE